MAETWRELILNLENALKRTANLERWDAARFDKAMAAITRIRVTMHDYLDQTPRKKDVDLAETINDVMDDRLK